MTFLLRGRRSIWWGCNVMPVAPRIVNDVSYERRIDHDIPFAWQAQYLVRLQGDSCRSAHCEMMFHMWAGSIMTFLLRGRRTLWWGCRVIPVAPRIVNDVSHVSRITHDIPCAWQAHYLVRLQGSCRSAHCKWPIMLLGSTAHHTKKFFSRRSVWQQRRFHFCASSITCKILEPYDIQFIWQVTYAHLVWLHCALYYEKFVSPRSIGSAHWRDCKGTAHKLDRSQKETACLLGGGPTVACISEVHHIFSQGFFAWTIYKLLYIPSPLWVARCTYVFYP